MFVFRLVPLVAHRRASIATSVAIGGGCAQHVCSLAQVQLDGRLHLVSLALSTADAEALTPALQRRKGVAAFEHKVG